MTFRLFNPNNTATGYDPVLARRGLNSMRVDTTSILIRRNSHRRPRSINSMASHHRSLLSRRRRPALWLYIGQAARPCNMYGRPMQLFATLKEVVSPLSAYFTPLDVSPVSPVTGSTVSSLTSLSPLQVEDDPFSDANAIRASVSISTVSSIETLFDTDAAVAEANRLSITDTLEKVGGLATRPVTREALPPVEFVMPAELMVPTWLSGELPADAISLLPSDLVAAIDEAEYPLSPAALLPSDLLSAIEDIEEPFFRDVQSLGSCSGYSSDDEEMARLLHGIYDWEVDGNDNYEVEEAEAEEEGSSPLHTPSRMVLLTRLFGDIPRFTEPEQWYNAGRQVAWHIILENPRSEQFFDQSLRPFQGREIEASDLQTLSESFNAPRAHITNESEDDNNDKENNAESVDQAQNHNTGERTMQSGVVEQASPVSMNLHGNNPYGFSLSPRNDHSDELQFPDFDGTWYRSESTNADVSTVDINAEVADQPAAAPPRLSSETRFCEIHTLFNSRNLDGFWTEQPFEDYFGRLCLKARGCIPQHVSLANSDEDCLCSPTTKL